MCKWAEEHLDELETAGLHTGALSSNQSSTRPNVKVSEFTQPGILNAALARAAFVTAQTMQGFRQISKKYFAGFFACEPEGHRSRTMTKTLPHRPGRYFSGISMIGGLMLSLAGATQAQTPRFAGVFGDHAVLQRDEPVRVWGTAAPSHALNLSLNGQTVAATTDAKGHWQASLPSMPAGGPYTLSISDDSTTTTVSDIMIGDVFLCSGQSNMEFLVKWATNAWGGIYSPVNSNLRFINIAQNSETTPLAELKTAAVWQVAGPSTTPEASAVCYYMATAIQAEQKLPVGMIDAYWGGTRAQAWISKQGLHSLHIFDSGLDALTLYTKSPDAAKTSWHKMTRDSWQASEPDAATKLRWTKPDFDDADWKSMTPSGMWRGSGDPQLTSFDGIVWFRQTLTLTEAEARSAVRISLGAVDDADITWVNGTAVGNTIGWDEPRDYPIPPGTLKSGKNVVVMRVVDTGGGVLWRKLEDRKLMFADGNAEAMPEIWKYRISGRINPGEPMVNVPWSSPQGLTNLYNGMIAPLTPYTLKAVAWYQGESNTYSPPEYAKLLPALMKDWRKNFGKPDLPFLVVQLANYGPVATKPGHSSWAEVREVQHRAVQADAHAALTVAIDFGDRSDIHPAQKTIIGNRLARNARAVVYGENVSPGGPEAVSAARSGADLVITFKDTNGGLRTYSSDTAISFEVCSGDACRYAIATISGDTVVLKGANALDVTAIRYAWADSPYTNLYSADDLPAVPFEMAVAK